MLKTRLEIMMFLVAALGFAAPACDREGAGLGNDENCTDGSDNDGDGDVDCDDFDCAQDPACAGFFEIDCADGLDDDSDNLIDCMDPDCAADPACTAGGETDCANGADDDGDGDTDCADADCAADPACNVVVETRCADGLDDDGDGDIDCADADCAGDPACGGSIENNCSDGTDNDGDGDIDCADADCTDHPDCGGSGWTCGQMWSCAQTCGADFQCLGACRQSGCAAGQTLFDDLSGCVLTTCFSDCQTDPGGPLCLACINQSCSAELAACNADTCAPLPVESDCTNGVDDDGDGNTDCSDSDCSGDPTCSDWDCSQVLSCSLGCGTDFQCIGTCRGNGCPDAQAAYDALATCTLTNCAQDCFADPGSIGCIICLATACPTEQGDCQSQSCTTGNGETDCTNGVDDDNDGDVDCADSDCVNDPACVAPGTWNCADIMACAQACPAGDLQCIQACDANGCPDAQTVWGDFTSCLFNSCFQDCVPDPSTPACVACLGTNCATEQSNCLSHTCP